MIDTLAQWHAIVSSRNMAALADLLADNVVFHSPVVHTPQHGKAITQAYLHGAMEVLNSAHFRYEREIVGPRDAVLEFVTQIDGVHVNGIDLIRWGDDGRITDFKVMVRPLKAVNALHAKMAAVLQKAAPAPVPVPKTPATFDEFAATARAEGFDEVLVREWQPAQVLDTHSHPFEVQARVVRGEVWLTCGADTRHITAGGGFELARDIPHAERYGAEGATFWVARRNAPAH